jgi:predicted PhzF superfamily epimerase YddE/YHI9
LDEDISDQLKQQIAAEMNISETAFLTRVESSASGDFTSGHHFGLRWFTPTTEVIACGLNFLRPANFLYNFNVWKICAFIYIQ